MHRLRLRAVTLLAVGALALAACGDGGSGSGSDDGSLTIYSGRTENIIAPLFEQFTRDTGIEVSIRYGESAELAAQISEEGDRSRADVFLSQDAGALGAVAQRGLLAQAPAESTALVDSRFRAKDGTWVGVSGRARVIVYDPAKVPEAQMPNSVFALTDPTWKGRIGIAPTNASFQSFVTGMRVQAGEARTREWLQGLKANDPRIYEGNAAIVKAVNDGQLDIGLVNHYYLYGLQAEIGKDKVVARNHYPTNGDPGALINVAGAGILKSSDHQQRAAQFVNYLLSPSAQHFFAEKTFEYPLIAGVNPLDLPPLSQIQSPNIDLADLSSLEQTLTVLREVGLL